MPPSWDQTGVPPDFGFSHFHSSWRSGSAARMSRRTWASVSPRQSPSSRIRSVIFAEAASSLMTRILSVSPQPAPHPCDSVDEPMRFVVDCGVVLRLASERIEVPADHKLLAPTLLRSQTLSALHETVRRGEIPRDVALDRLARISAMPIRLLGDAVLRRRAWEIAEQLGWDATY